MPCRFASSGTVATSRSASRAILALNVASNFLRDLVISVLHLLRQSRTLHTLTFGPISGVHFSAFDPSFARTCQARYDRTLRAGSHQRDPRGHEPVGSAHSADIGEAAGISHGDHGSSRSGD